MAFAKLSGALLARKDAQAAPSLADLVSVPVAGTKPPPGLAPASVDDEAAKLLAEHLKALKLPAFLGEYQRLAAQAASEGLDHSHYLLRLAELELVERQRRLVERRIKAARFPAVKELQSFDFAAAPSLDRGLVRRLADCGYIERRENVIIVGNSGTGKTHIAIALGLAACRNGLSVGFFTAGSLMHELQETSDERRLSRLQSRLAAYKLLIIDELGYVPLPTAGAELLFEVVSQRYERGSTIITSNLPVDQWSGVLGSAPLAAAVLDRLTHHVHILDLTGESYRLRTGRQRSAR